MEIKLKPTTQIVQLEVRGGGSISARLWEGTTDRGTPCFAFISRIAPTVVEPVPHEIDREFGEVLRLAATTPQTRGIELRYFTD